MLAQLRLTSLRGAALLALVLFHGACGRSPKTVPDAEPPNSDLLPFLGVWTYEMDAEGNLPAIGGCGVPPEPLEGVSPALVDDAGLKLVMGPGCRLSFDVRDGIAELQTPDQTCDLSLGLTTASGSFSSFMIEPIDEDHLRTTAQGGGDIFVDDLPIPLACDGVALSGQLRKQGPPPAAFPEYAVGVVAAAATAPAFCPSGWNRAPVTIRMDDEDDSRCGAESDDRHEGTWLLPSARKYPNECQIKRDLTQLDICRATVDEDAFRPLTTDPSAVEHFYATLAFDDQCPRGATRITKIIANEETDNDSMTSVPTPLRPAFFAPNSITTNAELKSSTQLVFCYFQWAETDADTMDAFPDLGFPYAVFHDFEGRQPGWVLRKRWQLSDDANAQGTPGTANRYVPSPETRVVVRDFQAIIEDTSGFNTYFDMARVR